MKRLDRSLIYSTTAGIDRLDEEILRNQGFFRKILSTEGVSQLHSDLNQRVKHDRIHSPVRKDAYGIDQIGDQSSENIITRHGIDEEKRGQIPEKQRSFFAIEQDLCERLLVVYEKCAVDMSERVPPLSYRRITNYPLDWSPSTRHELEIRNRKSSRESNDSERSTGVRRVTD